MGGADGGVEVLALGFNGFDEGCGPLEECKPLVELEFAMANI